MRPADELLSELGERLGLEGCKFDGEGCCTLVVDGLATEIDTDDGRLVALSAVVAELPEPGADPALCEAMLRGNYFQLGTAGATLGYDAASKIVSLTQRERVDGMSASEFHDWIERFVNTAESWKARVEGWEPMEAANADVQDEPAFAFRV